MSCSYSHSADWSAVFFLNKCMLLCPYIFPLTMKVERNRAITGESKANLSVGLLLTLPLACEAAQSGNVGCEDQATGTAVDKSFMLHLWPTGTQLPHSKLSRWASQHSKTLSFKFLRFFHSWIHFIRLLCVRSFPTWWMRYCICQGSSVSSRK